MQRSNRKVNPNSATSLAEAARYHLEYTVCEKPDRPTVEGRYLALANAIKDSIVGGLNQSSARREKSGAKEIYYLSMEFLIGRLLLNNLNNLGLTPVAEEAAQRLGLQLVDVLEAEPDPALGNGGLGRLAACFLDSLATLGYPGHGYGINYEYGLFQQSFINGFQRERPDAWRVSQSPWLIERYAESRHIPLYGRVLNGGSIDDLYDPQWHDWSMLVGVPSDMPVVGYGGKTVNFLRLFAARSSDHFDMAIFNEGDYFRAMQQKISSETVSKVLYPADSTESGKELRLIQEYFLVACALRDIMGRVGAAGHKIEALSSVVAIQMNDTHPSLAVPELMRILVDEYCISWDAAWETTNATLAYTNHTLLPEALERWPVYLMEKVLPRHVEIIYEINRRFLGTVAQRFPGDLQRLRSMSIIEEGANRSVRMANLCIVGSHSVNGVAEVHSELVKHQLVPEFNELWPQKFNNKTNGVTPRRWILGANPRLANLITEAIGPHWVTDLERLQGLEPLAMDAAFVQKFMSVKAANKRDLVGSVWQATGVRIDPCMLYDVQIKRVHEYKRQLLNALHIMHLYHRIVQDGAELAVPQVFIFAGKAAPGYTIAKLIIKLINAVSARIEASPQARQQLRVAFYPDYRVSVAERIVPAADLSEQISTAGCEASGTGNMKLALNGALTIGTLDGANIEIAAAVGAENFYTFGLNVEEVNALRVRGYDSRAHYEDNPLLRRVVDSLVDGTFSPGDDSLFRPLYQLLLNDGDFYLNLTDFVDYARAHEVAASDFLNAKEWARRAILNVARCGRFSSDRAIREYARDIWEIKPDADA